MYLQQQWHSQLIWQSNIVDFKKATICCNRATRQGRQVKGLRIVVDYVHFLCLFFQQFSKTNFFFFFKTQCSLFPFFTLTLICFHSFQLLNGLYSVFVFVFFDLCFSLVLICLLFIVYLCFFLRIVYLFCFVSSFDVFV